MTTPIASDGDTTEHATPVDEPVSSRERIAARRRIRSTGQVRQYALIALAAIVVVLGGGVWYFDSTFATRVYPNITVASVPVGALTPDEAAAAIETHFADYTSAPVALAFDEQTVTPTLTDLGAELDIPAAVAQAMTVGRDDNLFNRLTQGFATWSNGYEVPLALTVDAGTLQTYLQTALADLNIAPRDASLTVDTTYAEPAILVQPAVDGQQVLYDDTATATVAALQSLTPQTVAVRTRPLSPLLPTAAAEATAAELNALAQAPLTLEARDGVTWQWSPNDLLNLVTLERVSATDHTGDTLALTIDEQQIDEHLTWYAQELRVEGVMPRITLSNGSWTVLEPGTSGSIIDVEASTALVLEAMNGGERTLAVPYTELPVPSTDAELAALGLNDLLGVGRSSFVGSEGYRVTNVVAGMNLLHGVLVPPGAEFSFNETIGYIGPENGFVEGYAILGDKVGLEWGGGICQDSTTMYRAAFWAGLPITEWHAHSSYIDWYDPFGYGEYGNGPGMDATIFLGGPDLRFLNDTGNWIVIQAYANTGNMVASIEIWGTSDGRTTRIDQPIVSEWRTGFKTVAITRTVERDSEVLYNATFTSNFVPWGYTYDDE